MITAAIGLLLLARPSSSLPTYGPWKSSQVGGGGFVQGVELTPKNRKRAYAWVDVGGFYRSDDAGRNWRMLQGGLPPTSGNQAIRDLAADPRDPDRFLVAAGDHWVPQQEGIWSTIDGGQTFRKVLTAAFAGNSDYRWTGRLIRFNPSDPNRVLVGTMGTGVFLSQDGGKSFANLGLSGVNATDVDWDRNVAGRAWVCAQPYDSWYFGKEQAGLIGGFYRTKDAGKSWEKLADDGPTEVLQTPGKDGRLLGIFKRGRLIQQSQDLGETWAPLTEGLKIEPGSTQAPSEFEYQTLAAGPDFVLTQSTEGTVYRLAAGGTRWTTLSEPRVHEMYAGKPWYGAWDGKGWRHFGKAAAQLTIDPYDPRRWFFTDWYAIWQTLDAGKSWTLSMDGVEVTVVHTLIQDPANASIVHLGMADNGYLRSTDGGESFAPGRVNANMKAVAVSPADPLRLLALGDPGSGQWFSNTLFRSLDRGASWAKVGPKGLPDMGVRRMNSVTLGLQDPNRVSVAVDGPVKPGQGGVYRSEDGGKQFVWAGQGLPSDQPFFQSDIWVVGKELAQSRDGTEIAISTVRREVWRYDPAAHKWTICLESGATPNDVVADPRQPGVYYLARREEGLLKSTDSGRTWSRIFKGSVAYVTVDAAHPDRVAIGYATGVSVSFDGGRTWKKMDDRLPNRLNPRVAFSGNRVVAATGGSGTFWAPLPMP